MRFTPKDSNEGFRWILRAVVIAFVLVIVYQLGTKKQIDGPMTTADLFGPDGSSYIVEEAIKKKDARP
ncbi:hypothetical protein [Spirosoma foliorum]|uniref:hypothetical protein n=1 Tax=Spirosoma foliorum TaxID=2710596 RepID=UPI001C714981|nr:hypothetical protein [Spirosoma foliorum]